MDYDGEAVKSWAGNSHWRAWQSDFARYRKCGYSGWGSEGFWMITVYRLQRWLRERRPYLLWLSPRIAVGAVKKVMTLLTHINLNADAQIGPGLLIPHVGAIQVVPGAVIGADCAIHQVCTIGAGGLPGSPTIGDHVMLGCHSCVLGPIRIGDRVIVGAGAVVVKDIPSDCTAVGVPARATPRS